ncbi:MAG: hypothetical protein U0271_08560 [Polyangiaceae bacterium]
MSDSDRPESPSTVTPQPGDVRLLRSLVREAAQEPVPELNWDALEARLFADLEGEASSPELSGPRRSNAVERPSEIPAERPSQVPAIVAPAVATERESFFEAAPAERPSAPLRAGKRRGAPRTWTVGVAAAILAAAAVVAGFWVRHDTRVDAPVAVAEPIDPSTIAPAPGLPGARDLGALKAGDVIEAATGPLRFGQVSGAGGASTALEWTLLPGGRLRVVEAVGAQDGHVVELESGALRAASTTQASAPFVVRAGDAEIASLVEGTVFSVTRSSKKLVVHVERGRAAVAPTGACHWQLFSTEGCSEAQIFDSPLRAAVSLDGRSLLETIPAEVAAVTTSTAPLAPEVVPPDGSTPEVTQPRVVLPVAPTSPRPRIDSVEPAPTAPTVDTSIASTAPPVVDTSTATATVSAQPPVSSEGSVQGRLLACMKKVQSSKQPGTNGQVAVSVNSTLRLTVGDDGSVKGASFNPPLLPELQSCAVFLLHERFTPGARTVTIPVSL